MILLRYDNLLVSFLRYSVIVHYGKVCSWELTFEDIGVEPTIAPVNLKTLVDKFVNNTKGQHILQEQ